MIIRNQKLSRYNRFVCKIFSSRYLSILKPLVKNFLHIEIPKNLIIRMPHLYNITINPGAIIGANVTVYHGVTIGSSQFGKRAGAPIIGDNVVIYPNSVIVGLVSVGHGAIIGAGSVVISDVPENCVVAGNPAKKIHSVCL